MSLLNTSNSLPNLRDMIPKATDKVVISDSDLLNPIGNDQAADIVRNSEEPTPTTPHSSFIEDEFEKERKELELIKGIIQSLISQILDTNCHPIEDSNLTTVLNTGSLNEWWVNVLNTIVTRIDLLSERYRIIAEETERRTRFVKDLMSGVISFAKDFWEYLRQLPEHLRTKLLLVPKPIV